MAIEETLTRFVAAADWTDDCRVIVRVRRKSTLLSAAEARELAQELLQAAWNAEDAAADAVHPVEASRFDTEHLHPECIAGKCGNCDGEVLTLTDEWVPCAHLCHEDGAA